MLFCRIKLIIFAANVSYWISFFKISVVHPYWENYLFCFFLLRDIHIRKTQILINSIRYLIIQLTLPQNHLFSLSIFTYHADRTFQETSKHIFFSQTSIVSMLDLIYHGKRQVKRKNIFLLEQNKPFRNKIEKAETIFFREEIFITKFQSQQSPGHK